MCLVEWLLGVVCLVEWLLGGTHAVCLVEWLLGGTHAVCLVEWLLGGTHAVCCRHATVHCRQLQAVPILPLYGDGRPDRDRVEYCLTVASLINYIVAMTTDEVCRNYLVVDLHHCGLPASQSKLPSNCDLHQTLPT